MREEREEEVLKKGKGFWNLSEEIDNKTNNNKSGKVNRRSSEWLLIKDHHLKQTLLHLSINKYEENSKNNGTL